jgi:hypothetical protein
MGVTFLLLIFLFVSLEELETTKDFICVQFEMKIFPCVTREEERNCIFCDIQKQRNLVYEVSRINPLIQDDRVVAFNDINPSGKLHYLVIPRDHIGTLTTTT